MKTALHLLLAATLSIGAAGSFVSSHIQAAEAEKAAPAADSPRAILERGQAAGALPEGMVIRFAACLGVPDGEDPKVANGLNELWEIDSKEVHRLVRIAGAVECYQRAESRPLSTADLCGALLNGKAIEIEQRKGKGPQEGLIGSGYRRGSRSIEVIWQGKTIIDLHETNGAVPDFYAKTDAIAFGELYENLASRAREAFKAKEADAAKR